MSQAMEIQQDSRGSENEQSIFPHFYMQDFDFSQAMEIQQDFQTVDFSPFSYARF